MEADDLFLSGIGREEEITQDCFAMLSTPNRGFSVYITKEGEAGLIAGPADRKNLSNNWRSLVLQQKPPSARQVSVSLIFVCFAQCTKHLFSN
jgi:hypothetical protein